MNKAYPLVPLSELLSQFTEYIDAPEPKVYPKLSVRLYGKGVVLDDPADGSLLKMKRHQLARNGQVILSEIWGKRGAIGFVPPEGDGALCTSHFFLFDVRTGRLLPRYLGAIFAANFLESQLGVEAKGTTGYAAVRPKHLLAARIPLPPLDEQRRIVARIEELARKLHTAQALQRENTEAVSKLFGAEIQRLFAGQLHGWNCGHLGDYVVDACYGTSEKTTDDSSGTPILRMGNIQNGRLQTRDLKYLHIAEKNRPSLILKNGDILVNRTNSAELVGKCAVFDVDGEFGFASYIIRLRLDTSRALPQLVASYINSPAGRAYMFNERKQMTGQANVNLQKLRALPISLPSVPEQTRLLGHLAQLESKLDCFSKLQSETAAELDALMPSIFSKAFRGEL